MTHVRAHGIDGLGQVSGGTIEQVLSRATAPDGILIKSLIELLA
jgi:hypothetical protein